jgi:homoserine dehydrogenase
VPTGSAVVGDIIDVSRNLLQTARGPIASDHRRKPLRPIEELQTQYYVLLAVEDVPGVLAEVARTFGDHDVSIAQVWQEGSGDTAQLVLITHRSREGDLRECVESLETSSCVRKVTSVLRVESEVWS